MPANCRIFASTLFLAFREICLGCCTSRSNLIVTHRTGRQMAELHIYVPSDHGYNGGVLEKGKPAARRGRKATGLSQG